MLDPKSKALELIDEHYTEIIGMGVSEEVLKAYAVKLALITLDKMYQVAKNMDEVRLMNYCDDVERELLSM
jgi:hypothetical protein